MTYCIAWKTDDAAFLIADSAVTRVTPTRPELGDLSSFGEKQGKMERSGRFVYEEVYKIYTTNNVAISFAGDSVFGNEFVSLVIGHLELGRCLYDSINLAASNYQNLSRNERIKVVFITYTDSPKIYTLDNKQNPSVTEIDEYVSLGSPPQDLSNYTDAFYRGFKDSWIKERKHRDANEVFLLRMLALLQIYSIHNYTIENGIGGAYTGVSSTKDGLTQETDICYVISGKNPEDGVMISSIHVDEDCFCIINTNAHNLLLPNIKSRKKQELSTVLDDAIQAFDSGRFKHVVFLNRARHVAFVIKMNYKHHHELLSMDVQDDMPGTLGFVFDERLLEIINDRYEVIDTPKYALIAYQGYVAPSEDNIRYIEKQIGDMRKR